VQAGLGDGALGAITDPAGHYTIRALHFGVFDVQVPRMLAGVSTGLVGEAVKIIVLTQTQQIEQVRLVVKRVSTR
jgi:hypothetical protein